MQKLVDFLTVDGDGYVSGFEKNGFQYQSNTYLAEITYYTTNAVADIKNTGMQKHYLK